MDSEINKSILWVDPDIHLLVQYVDFLNQHGYKIQTAETLTGGEKFLATQKYDFLILDIMISPTEEEEISDYKVGITKYGDQSGLVFFKRMKNIIKEKKIRVLVFTQRIDLDIQSKFIDEGLPKEAFVRKIDMPEVRQLMEKLVSLESADYKILK